MALPKLIQAGTTTRRYQLTASKGLASFAQDGKQTNFWLYKNTTPGPLLKAKKGEFLEVEFINRLGQPTTIQRHGIRHLNEMDGVPGLTQVALEPGEKFMPYPISIGGKSSILNLNETHTLELPLAKMHTLELPHERNFDQPIKS
tara:strand:+ start:154 stop:588 length:435 start_codon:yes stop_codon:yes gene_type:complete